MRPALLITLLLSISAQSADTRWVAPVSLTPELYTAQAVCARAREMSEKPFVLVAIKSHACDHGPEQLCLKESYSLADPAHVWIRRDFDAFQLRLQINERKTMVTRSQWSQSDQGSFQAEWGDSEDPRWVVLDKKSCRLVASVPREKLHPAQSLKWIGSFRPAAADLAAMYAFQDAALRVAFNVPAPASADPDTSRELQARQPQGQPKLTELWDLLDRSEVPANDSK